MRGLWEKILIFFNLVVDMMRLFRLKWWKSIKQGVENDTNSPYINTETVSSAL